MFKISFMNYTHMDQKMKYIDIEHGYDCRSHSYCKYRTKCKYHSKYRFHNWSVAVHRFFEFHFHIKLPHWLCIHKKYVDFSGTSKCPFHTSRRYTCWDCKYTSGQIDGECLHPLYASTPLEELKVKDDPNWEGGRCSLFEKNEWADQWDKDTGETN